MIYVGLYLFIGAASGVVVMTTFPEEDRGPYFFVLPALMPILWGPVLFAFFLDRWLG